MVGVNGGCQFTAPVGGSCGHTMHYRNPPPAITNTYHYQPTHLSHYPPLPPPTMMAMGGVSGWWWWLGGRLQWVAVLGGAGELPFPISHFKYLLTLILTGGHK